MSKHRWVRLLAINLSIFLASSTPDISLVQTPDGEEAAVYEPPDWPPVITLQSDPLLMHKLRKVHIDNDGIPCDSLVADEVSCKMNKYDEKFHRYYAMCTLHTDTFETCPEPSAKAWDHEDGELQVVRSIKLYVKFSGTGHKIVNQDVDEINFSQRGHYAFTYSVQDTAGNRASESFHYFVGNPMTHRERDARFESAITLQPMTHQEGDARSESAITTSTESSLYYAVPFVLIIGAIIVFMVRKNSKQHQHAV